VLVLLGSLLISEEEEEEDDEEEEEEGGLGGLNTVFTSISPTAKTLMGANVSVRRSLSVSRGSDRATLPPLKLWRGKSWRSVHLTVKACTQRGVACGRERRRERVAEERARESAWLERERERESKRERERERERERASEKTKNVRLHTHTQGGTNTDIHTDTQPHTRTRDSDIGCKTAI